MEKRKTKPNKIRFSKLQGAGNDYIALDGRDLSLDFGLLSKNMSRPHFGVFSDGIVVVEDSKISDIKMRVFNPDGSEAEMSGNGIRLFSKFVLDNKIVEFDPKGLEVETLGGIRTVFPKMFKGKMVSGKVAMGIPKFKSSEIPVLQDILSNDEKIFDYILDLGDESIKISCVNIGNPHAVHITDTPVEEFDLERIGPIVENHKFFPNRINFEIVNVISESEIKARIFERGAGETLSSGTGSSASAIISMTHNLVTKDVKVNVPGGSLFISWNQTDEVYLEGPTQEVFKGEWLIKDNIEI
ncbi:MAG: diaminopimelate epimerase [Chloroflexi bacterium]|nr:diaminopimelate epimerase [Chloroflexota bacterium]|tara:strand:+ start:21345 stop:22241 length:897 start_codon:yes stop_codon:yes gene_type:complete